MNTNDIIKKMIKDFNIVDAHFDLPYDLIRQKENGNDNVLQNIYIPKFKKGGVNLVVASIYVDNIYIPELALKRALDQISVLLEEVKKNSNDVAICKNYENFIETKKNGKIAIMISLEGVEPINMDLDLLNIFYELGVRIIGLVWSRRNYAGNGSSFTSDKRKLGGLSDFGIEVVKKAEELGMIIDVSHLNDKGFEDVVKYSRKRIIATHSNCRSICETERNLLDKQIKDISKKQGVIGINNTSILISKEDKDSNIDYLIKHINHIVDLVGIDYVCLGLDFCDQFKKYVSSEKIKNLNREPFDVISGHDNIRIIAKKLYESDYKSEEIEKILGNNFISILKNL